MGFNSSIKRKKCKCGNCDKFPTLGYAGYFAAHAPKEIIDKVGTKRQVQLRNRNKRLAQGRKLHQAQDEAKTASGELMRWFNDRHKEMTGSCKHCLGKTQKGQPNFINSIAHILPKALFPSVKTHPDNWIELCFYNKSCHANFDNHMIDITELNCFDLVIERFVRIYPFIAPQEKRRIPEVLLQYIEVEK